MNVKKKNNSRKGLVIWLVGISGAGKTTLGNILKSKLDALKIPNFKIDGDNVRSFFENDLGYSKEDRVANIKRILFGTYVLSHMDGVTIVCNIHPFQFLRDFARKKIPNYNEIYLHKSLRMSVKRDVKTIYRKNLGKTALIGIDIPFEKPRSCDLKIDVDRLNVQQSFEKLNRYLRTKYSNWPL